jgi:hypothetical protein
MTDIEAKQTLVDALAAFPGVAAWIKANSPDPAATIRVWAKSLESLERSEVESVIARWCTGVLEAPEGYKKECFHLHIRAVVMADRAKQTKERVREETLRANKRGSGHFYNAILGPFMASVMKVKNQYDNGLITKDERDDRIGELRDEAIAKVDQKSGSCR